MSHLERVLLDFLSEKAKKIFRSPTLKSQSFAAPWGITMKSSSFESPKPYLFALSLRNSIEAFLKYVILAQTSCIHVLFIQEGYYLFCHTIHIMK